MRIARNPPTPTSLSYSENMAVYYLFDNQGLKKRSPFPTLENAPKERIFYSVANYFPREGNIFSSGGNKNSLGREQIFLRGNASTIPFELLFDVRQLYFTPKGSVKFKQLFFTSSDIFIFSFLLLFKFHKKNSSKVIHLSTFFSNFAAQNNIILIINSNNKKRL